MKEKILFCGFIICSLAFLQCLGASLRLNNVADKNDKHLEIFEQYMNRTINPCDDFYGYSCDKWSDVHRIWGIGGELTKTSYALIDEITKTVNKPLVEIIENYKPVSEFYNLYDIVWNYYTTCRLSYLPDPFAYIEYLKYADELDWPLLSQNITKRAFQSFNDNFNWFLKLAKLNRYDLDILLKHTLERSKDDPNEYFIALDKPKCYSVNLIDQYDSYLISILQSIGIKQNIAVAVNEEIYAFEKKLRDIVKNSTDYEWTVSTIDELPDDLPWQKYLETLLGHKVDGNYRVRIRNLNYFKNLTKLIQTSPSSAVYNYILIKFVLGAIDDCPRNQPLSCMHDLRRHMEPAINFIYDTHIYRPHAAAYNADVQRIFNRIREALSRRLDLNEMNLKNEEIQQLQKKLHSMNLIMNNLPANVDLEFLDHYFRDLELDSRSFHKNQLATMKFRFDKEFSQLFNPVQERDKYFPMGKHKKIGTCGTSYLYDRNSILVPYCLLQSPMYELELYDVYKFSMFGFLLAHEMLHAFDYFGIQYDFEGKPENVSSSVPFQVSSCMIDHPPDQYQERYVDYIAIRTVYDIMFPENMENNIEALENRETMERQFFEHFAHFFCGELMYTPGSEDHRDYRLYLAIRHFEPFNKNFQCKVDKDAYTGNACF